MITEKQRAYNREHYQKWLLNHKERRDELNRECAKRKRARGIMDYVKIGVDFRKTHPLASGCHIKVYEAVKSGKLKKNLVNSVKIQKSTHITRITRSH